MTLQEPGDLGYNDFHVSLFYLAIIDFENIQEPNVTIALKNLAKKNAVTKEKRLNEFLRMLENSSFDVKDYHILVCWLQLYPRLAIDSQRTVRHLAHQILATYMRLYGVKEFSRYLRTAMPIWLQGLFDDKVIANSVKGDLLKSFSNDEAKVNVKIWIVFHEQIINYCHAVLVHESAASITDERSESAEEVIMKYDRAVNSALAMFMQIIRLANTQEYFISESASVQINEILTSEQFWGNLGQCGSKDNFNTALLRSFLALISEMFSLDAGAPKQFTARLKETKSIYKLVSKNILRNVKISPASDTTSSVMYSTIIIPLMNVLTLLTNFSNQSSIKIKKNFWQYGGSKSFSRLKDILKLGPCNSAPNYYNSLYELLAAVETSGVQPAENFAFLDFSNYKDAKNILQKILLPQILKLKGYNVFSFKYSAIQCVNHVFQLFERHIPHSPELAVLAQTIFFSLLDCISIARMTKEDLRVKTLCITSLAQFYNAHLISQHAEMNEAILALLEDGSNKSINKLDISNDLIQVCTNYYFIMREISLEKSDTLLRASLESLESSYDPDTISHGFTIMFNILSHIKENEIIEEWLVINLAGFVSKEFVELPLKILSKILQAGLNLDLGQLFNDLFLKISDECPKYLPQLLGMIRQTTTFDGNSLEVAIPDAYLHLLSISKDVKRSDSENNLILEFVAETEILSNLLHSTVDTERQTKLITSLAAHTQMIDLSAFDSAAIKPLVLCALEFSVHDSSAKFLVLHVAKDIVREAIYEKLLAWGPDHDFSSLVTLLTKDKALLPLEELESMVNHALSNVDLALLSISNPLSQAIHMISCSDKASLSTTILTIASFLKVLTESPVFKESSIFLLKNMCIEYTIDFQFLNQSKEDEIFAISNHWATAADSLLLQMNNADIADFFNGTAPDGQIEAYSKVVSGKGAFCAKQYYVSRSLVRTLTPVFDSMSLSDFDNLEIAYTKLSNHPLKLAILLSSAKKFVGISSKLDRIRNYVFAEILGVRTTTQICESGIVWLSLANSFVEVDAPYDVIPTHKLGMLINQVSSWLECDIAFDPSFIALRTLLASFLSHLIRITGAGTPDKTWSLAVDLCLNNLGMAQLDYDTTALEYFSLKLFLTLSRYVDTTIFTDWKQSRISIEEEVLSLALFKSKGLQHRRFNKPTELVYDLFERALSKATISKVVLSESSENLYLMLANSRIVGSQKIASFLLKKFIYENQQDAILEVHMRRSNLSGEESSVGELTTLNKQLLHAISDKNFHVDSALENNDHSGLFKYLWSWILVFDHVKESTYSMKAEYINQLKACDAISFLLDTIFETLPLTEQAFLNQLVVEPVEKTEKAKPSQSLIQDYDIKQSLVGKSVKEEVYFLLAHLCYRTFQFLGSFASQWFDEIRDVQLKLQVEKFAKRFVSPILISKMLQEVDKSKDQLIKNDSTLTIKVNRIAYEIKSIYVIDEQTMEMVIKVPEKFPLANVTVEGPTRLGVKENQWKAWLLASQRVISLTNGSLFDSIELFNKNVNLHFSGFEECAICYSILHQDHSLPSKNCPTCSNKFHAACLYKWFKSSGSSTCPLCRSAFNFNTGKP